jgi:hypothetical protein
MGRRFVGYLRVSTSKRGRCRFGVVTVFRAI